MKLIQFYYPELELSLIIDLIVLIQSSQATVNTPLYYLFSIISYLLLLMIITYCSGRKRFLLMSYIELKRSLFIFVLIRLMISTFECF